MFANLYITQPLLPLLSAEFAVSPLQASWSLSLGLFTLGLSLLFYGTLSDAVGRRLIMGVTMVLAVLVTFSLSYVQDFQTLLALRAVQGFLLGGLPAIAIAYMGEEFSRKAMVFAVGLYISGNSLGGIAGRLIGGFVADWTDWRSAFLVMGIISLVCLLGYLWLLPPSRQFRAKPVRMVEIHRSLFGHLRNPRLLPAYLIGGLNFAIFISQYNYIIFVLSDAPYSLPSSLLGMLFLTYLSGTLGSAISGKAAHRIPQALCILIGSVVMMLGTLVTLIGGLSAIVAGLLLNALGFFFAHASASSWVSRHAHFAKASASSLYLMFYYLGASAGTFYMNPFWRAGGWLGVVLGSLLVLCATVTLAWILHRGDRAELTSTEYIPKTDSDSYCNQPN